MRYPYRYETEDGYEVLLAYNLTSLASLDVDVIKRRYPFVTRIETQTDHLDWTEQFFLNEDNVYKLGMEKVWVLRDGSVILPELILDRPGLEDAYMAGVVERMKGRTS